MDNKQIIEQLKQEKREIYSLYIDNLESMTDFHSGVITGLNDAIRLLIGTETNPSWKHTAYAAALKNCNQ